MYLTSSEKSITIDHSILKKQERYGVEGVCLDQLISYVYNRKQFVQVQGAQSNLSTISCSVPQGSIIGQLFFIIFNDTPNSWKDIISYLLLPHIGNQKSKTRAI